MEIIFVLFILFILLAIMTVVGHAIWWVIAAMIRYVFFSDRYEAQTGSHQVTRIITSSPNATDDLTVTERQIIRFYGEGKLDDATYERVMNRIRRNERIWSGRPRDPRHRRRPSLSKRHVRNRSRLHRR